MPRGTECAWFWPQRRQGTASDRALTRQSKLILAWPETRKKLTVAQSEKKRHGASFSDQ